jgi:prolyl 4-hydroxylase
MESRRYEPDNLAMLVEARRRAMESHPEIQASTDWAGLLVPETRTTLRQLPEPEARKRYAPDNLVMLVEGLLSGQECDAINESAEAIGFGKTNYLQEYRGNLRLIITDCGLAAGIWNRIRSLIPETLETCDSREGTCTWRAVGLNEVFRLAKYYEGHRFGAHCDAWFERNADERSFYTVNLYTNTVLPQNHGRTRFYTEKKSNLWRCARRAPRSEEQTKTDDFGIDLAVQPEAGLAVVFRHGPGTALLHDGEELGGGVKYLMRTDVMYRRVAK